MNYKFQFPPPIKKPHIQQPTHIPISSLPPSIRSSKSDLNSPLHTQQTPNLFSIKPSMMKKKKRQSKGKSVEKRSGSPAVKFNYLNKKEERRERKVMGRLNGGQVDYRREGKEIQQVVTEQHIISVNGEEEKGRNGKKITNQVYTNQQYKQKMVSPPQNSANSLEEDEQIKKPRTSVGGQLSELYDMEEELQQNVKDRLTIQKIQLEDIEKAKSEMLQQSYRINTRKIKQLEEKNKQLIEINQLQDKKIASLHDEIYQLRSIRNLNQGSKELGQKKEEYELQLRQKELQIKKLRNQIGLMRLREREMEIKMRGLERRGEKGEGEKGREKRGGGKEQDF